MSFRNKRTLFDCFINKRGKINILKTKYEKKNQLNYFASTTFIITIKIFKTSKTSFCFVVIRVLAKFQKFRLVK